MSTRRTAKIEMSPEVPNRLKNRKIMPRTLTITAAQYGLDPVASLDRCKQKITGWVEEAAGQCRASGVSNMAPWSSPPW
jgi:hypothetical protein